jgi:hypothetical protein
MTMPLADTPPARHAIFPPAAADPTLHLHVQRFEDGHVRQTVHLREPLGDTQAVLAWCSCMAEKT